MLTALARLISDLLGLGGRSILEALGRGEQDPERLTDLAQGRLKVKRRALGEALRGTSPTTTAS